jgi:hypothetical protein
MPEGSHPEGLDAKLFRSAQAQQAGPLRANSHLFGELNSIVELFTQQHKSTGFRSFAKLVHAL